MFLEFLGWLKPPPLTSKAGVRMCKRSRKVPLGWKILCRRRELAELADLRDKFLTLGVAPLFLVFPDACEFLCIFRLDVGDFSLAFCGQNAVEKQEIIELDFHQLT